MGKLELAQFARLGAASLALIGRYAGADHSKSESAFWAVLHNLDFSLSRRLARSVSEGRCKSSRERGMGKQETVRRAPGLR